MVSVVTYSKILNEEASMLEELANLSINRLHLRKMESINKVRSFMDKLSASVLNKVVIHNFIELTEEYPIWGVHFNSNHPFAEDNRNKATISVHSTSEAQVYDGKVEAIIFSPVFPSISKQGYVPTHSVESIKTMNASICNTSKRCALGGIKVSNCVNALKMGFNEVALYGTLWEKPEEVTTKDILLKVEAIIKRLNLSVHVV